MRQKCSLVLCYISHFWKSPFDWDKSLISYFCFANLFSISRLNFINYFWSIISFCSAHNTVIYFPLHFSFTQFEKGTAFKSEPGNAMVNTHWWDRVKCSKERFQFILQDTKVIPGFFFRLYLHNDIWSIQWLLQEIPVLYILFVLACLILSESVSVWCKTGELFKHFDL